MPHQSIFALLRSRFKLLSNRMRLGRYLACQVLFPEGNGVIVRDRHAKVVLISDSLLRSFGLSTDVHYGHRLSHYFQPELAQVIESLDDQAVQTQQAVIVPLPGGMTLTTNSKSTYRVTTTPVFRQDGQFEGYVSVIIDQTELHLAEQAAFASQQRYRFLFDAVPMPAGLFRVSFTDDGAIDIRLVEGNQALTRMLGTHSLPFDRSALETWPMFRDSEMLTQVAKMMADGPGFTHEGFSALYGRQFELTFRRFGEGLMFIFSHDITELRQAEQHILTLTHQLHGTQADQQRRTEALLEDANQFMSAVVDQLDETTAVLGQITEDYLKPEQAGPFQRVVEGIQDVSEKMMRYTAAGLLPTDQKLHDLQELMEELFVTMRPQYPFITFQAIDLPRLVISRDALISVFRNLVEQVCQGDGRSQPRQVIVRVVPGFLGSGLCVEFQGFHFSHYLNGIAEGEEVEANWELCGSLHMATVRRILAYYGARLCFARGPESSLRFFLRSINRS